jgi:hypothetical protein
MGLLLRKSCRAILDENGLRPRGAATKPATRQTSDAATTYRIVSGQADGCELVIAMTGSRSQLVFKPLPSDDPKQRQPDISLARGETRLGTQGRFARRAAAYH